MALPLLLLGSFWILGVSLCGALCIAARTGDHQHGRLPPPAVSGDPSADGLVTVVRFERGQHTAPGYSAPDGSPSRVAVSARSEGNRQIEREPLSVFVGISALHNHE
jgi:hypothetical protein